MTPKPLTVKDGVELDRLHPHFVVINDLVETLWAVVYSDDLDGPTITSGHEDTSKHGPTSKHYIKNCKSKYGEAEDLRMNDVKNARAQHFASDLEKYLLILHDVRVKVLLEDLLTPNAHFHVEVIL